MAASRTADLVFLDDIPMPEHHTAETYLPKTPFMAHITATRMVAVAAQRFMTIFHHHGRVVRTGE
jgi:hypothetical protein